MSGLLELTSWRKNGNVTKLNITKKEHKWCIYGCRSAIMQSLLIPLMPI